MGSSSWMKFSQCDLSRPFVKFNLLYFILLGFLTIFTLHYCKNLKTRQNEQINFLSRRVPGMCKRRA